ncbi:MAG: hypothetical protein NZ990_08410 [Myxococcota bacterium]|nr:hypothetical protein [Myxococcota bacterium]
MKSEMTPRSFAVRTRMTALWAIAIFVLAALPLSLGVGTAIADTKEPTTQSQVLAVGASCFYLPAKAFYAVFGAATAGLAYGFTLGDDELANQIWTASVEGSYIVTPAMIEGREPVRFKGP